VEIVFYFYYLQICHSGRVYCYIGIEILDCFPEGSGQAVPENDQNPPQTQNQETPLAAIGEEDSGVNIMLSLVLNVIVRQSKSVDSSIFF
jgi:hypothetical protein